MTVQIESTTDSKEAVTHAMGLANPESKVEEKSAPEAKKASEQKSASDSESEAKEEQEETDALEESESEEGDDKTDDSAKEKPKKKGGFQRRIDKLNSQKAEAQREAEYWKNKAMAGEKPAGSEKTEVEKPKSSEGKPHPDNFDTHTDYVEALTDWKTEQKFKAREQDQSKAQLQRDQDAALKSHFERVANFAEKTPDFQEVLESVDDVRISPIVEEVIVSSENGAALIYELAKNREEYERICKLPPIAAARELGKIEARLANSSDQKEPNKTTKTPKPLSPVSAKGGGSTKALDEMDYQEYKKAREQQLRKRA